MAKSSVEQGWEAAANLDAAFAAIRAARDRVTSARLQWMICEVKAELIEDELEVLADTMADTHDIGAVIERRSELMKEQGALRRDGQCFHDEARKRVAWDIARLNRDWPPVSPSTRFEEAPYA